MKLKAGIFVLILILGCSSPPKKLKHSFFIAGHTYGSTIEKLKTKGESKGLYSVFMEKVPFLRNQKKMTNGFLLGDSVWHPKYWPEALVDVETIGIPVEVVRGNHDGGLGNFKKMFGNTYKKFIAENNLYIILDSNIDGWNISGDQLVFLMNTLRNDTRKVDNVFIFSHHLLWYNKEKFSKPFPNSTNKRADETNFWNKIEPLIRNLELPVYLFAGDLGAFSKEKRKKDHIIEYYYHSYDNVTFIGTGMGGGVRDNLIIVDVFNDGSVEFRLIHLNGTDVNSLGKLEDYVDPNFVE